MKLKTKQTIDHFRSILFRASPESIYDLIILSFESADCFDADYYDYWLSVVGFKWESVDKNGVITIVSSFPDSSESDIITEIKPTIESTIKLIKNMRYSEFAVVISKATSYKFGTIELFPTFINFNEWAKQIDKDLSNWLETQ